MPPYQGEDRSRESSQRLLQIAEREVGRIILDIHDGPVQNIFAALSQLNVVQRNLERQQHEDDATNRERVCQSIALLEHALNEIRTFMGMFRPPEFERRDLLAVLDGLVIQHEELTGMPVHLEVEGIIPEVSLPVKIGLYRVLQEALSNAARHAQVDHHFILLRGEPDQITMEVSDTGKGFDVAAVMGQQEGVHIGLCGMQERVDILGGSIDIQSTPGAGTLIRVIIPYQGQ
jgi:signal transduction histidine kinase